MQRFMKMVLLNRRIYRMNRNVGLDWLGSCCRVRGGKDGGSRSRNEMEGRSL